MLYRALEDNARLDLPLVKIFVDRRGNQLSGSRALGPSGSAPVGALS